MKPKYKLLLLSLFILCNCFAQNKFKYQTFTDSVVKDGFYQINLLPEIVGKSKSALDDIRLFDIEGKQIPYLIKNASPAFERNEFIALKKLSDTRETDSTIIVENSNKIAIVNLALILKNSYAERSVNISGSDDLKHWYVIKEFINLEMTRDNDEKHFFQSIPLPSVDYEYLLIKFNSAQYDPMFIEQVGTYKTQKQLKNYFSIAAPKIVQHDSSNKFSYVKLLFNEHYRIEQLQLFISSAKFYERNIVFQNDFNRDQAMGDSKICKISSRSNNIFFDDRDLYLNKSDTLQFTIQNDDNPPLKIDSVKAYQNAYALFAYLKAGQKYKLAFGNDTLAAPVYDISAFSDSIKNATILPTGEITSNQITEDKTVVKSKSLSKVWLWTAIITVLLILLYFTSTMLKQINKR